MGIPSRSWPRPCSWTEVHCARSRPGSLGLDDCHPVLVTGVLPSGSGAWSEQSRRLAPLCFRLDAELFDG
jgi:hypothetical protein